MKQLKLLFIPLLFLTFYGSAQIIPAGLGKTTLNSWFAFGFNQKLDTLEKGGWNAVSYIGIGRISNQNTHNPFENRGIFILNQEFYHQFSKHWNYSLALSYRRQNLYKDEPNFELANPPLKQEFRFYSRFTYSLSGRYLSFSPTVRQEIIGYFTPSFESYNEAIRVRSRLRLKLTINLTKNKQHKISLYSEQLFSTSKQLNQQKWTSFEYKDSRFSAYYSLLLKNHPLTINIGYMYNLIGIESTFSGHYLSIDLIWKNLWRKKL